MRAKVSKQTEPKAETEVQKSADTKPAGAVEPSKEQLEKARVESEKALKEFERQGAGDSTLTRYFREMIGHRVLTPQEEIEAAKQVERLEIAYWEALLSYPSCFESVARFASSARARNPKSSASDRKRVGTTSVSSCPPRCASSIATASSSRSRTARCTASPATSQTNVTSSVTTSG
ncbi:MAG: hypothetical protein JRE82_05560 [Deltaproteobacteria bacterium]|nr:hypothetical protein [Deltaproteobacteria bacterium]